MTTIANQYISTKTMVSRTIMQNKYLKAEEEQCFFKQSTPCEKNFLLLLHIVWTSLKMSHLNFSILAFSTTFCPIKTDLSGNTVWRQASAFQKLLKMELFGIFN